MTKYKLRMVGPGDYLHTDDGNTLFIGDTAAEAHDFYADEWNDPVEWVHPEILRARILYARDIEAGDGHEDAAPGDTTYDVVTTHPDRAMRPLLTNEVRAWHRGPWRPWWHTGPADYNAPLRYQATIEDEVLGNDFASRQDAQAAVRRAEAGRVEQWKTNHPEFFRAEGHTTEGP